MLQIARIHEDDRELYNAKRLEPEQIAAINPWLSDRRNCLSRFPRRVEPQLKAVPTPHHRQPLPNVSATAQHSVIDLQPLPSVL